MYLDLNWQALCAPYQFMAACCSAKVPDGPQTYTVGVLWLQQEGAQTHTWLSEAKASHSQRMWAEVSSSAPHLRHNGLLDSPIRWRCLLRVLCPVRRQVTASDCVLLKDRNLVLVPRQGPEINSRACLWVSPRPLHHIQCWLTNHCLILLCISCLETPKASSGPTHFRAKPSLASFLVISLPHTPACMSLSFSNILCICS
jgi:hypothetical protein